MAAPLRAPELGGELKPGSVVQWYKDDGTDVAEGDAVFCFESGFVAVEVEAEAPGRIHRCFPPGTQTMPGNVVALILQPGELVPEHVEDAMAGSVITPPPDPEPEPEGREPIILPLRRGALKTPPSAPSGGAWDRAFGTSGHDYRGFWPLRDEIPGEGGPTPAEPAPRMLHQPHESTEAPYRDPIEAAFEAHAAAHPEYERDAGPDSEGSGFDDAAWPVDGSVPAEDEAGTFEAGAVYNPVADYVDDEPAVEPVAWRTPPAAIADGPVDEDVMEPEAAFEPADEAWAEDVPVYMLLAPVVLSGTVRLTEVRKLCEQLGREWRGEPGAPRNEDLVLRAAARAVQEHPVLAEAGERAGLVTPAQGADVLTILETAARGSLREKVAMLSTVEPSGEISACAFTVVTFAGYGVEAAVPVLPEGHAVAFAMGATRPGTTMEDGVPAPIMTLTIAYAAERLSQGDAAALFARTKELIEAPYALLAD